MVNWEMQIFIRNINKDKLAKNKEIRVCKKQVKVGKEIYCRIICYSETQLIKLLKQYPEDIIPPTGYKNNSDRIDDTLLYIIQKYDFELFKIFVDIFEICDTTMRLCNNDFLEAKDPQIFTYFINHILFQLENSEVIVQLRKLIQEDYYENDKNVDKYIEIMECMETNLNKKDIKLVLSVLYINFDTQIRQKIQYNNYKCTHVMIKYMRKYFPSVELNYGSAIATSICCNKLEFADMFIDFYHQEGKEMDSDNMIELFPNEKRDRSQRLSLIKDSDESIKLESLQYFYEKNMKGQFYSKTVTQLIIISSMQSRDRGAFAYMINVFPYEAMSLVGEKKCYIYNLKRYSSDFYQQLEELKQDFELYIE